MCMDIRRDGFLLRVHYPLSLRFKWTLTGDPRLLDLRLRDWDTGPGPGRPCGSLRLAGGGSEERYLLLKHWQSRVRLQ